MNPHDYSQKLIGLFEVAHGKSMRHCLDADRESPASKYAAYATVRDLLIRENQRAGMEMQAFQRNLHTVVIPAREKFLRKFRKH